LVSDGEDRPQSLRSAGGEPDVGRDRHRQPRLDRLRRRRTTEMEALSELTTARLDVRQRLRVFNPLG
jgi:hypothetical protein